MCLEGQSELLAEPKQPSIVQHLDGLRLPPPKEDTDFRSKFRVPSIGGFPGAIVKFYRKSAIILTLRGRALLCKMHAFPEKGESV